jgi:hypothetical protein
MNLRPPPFQLNIIDKTGQLPDQWQRYLLDLNSQVTDAAPNSAKYWVSQANALLTGEINLGALLSGYLKITVGGGIAAPLTVQTIPITDLTPAGTTTTVLHGNPVGAPSYGPVVENDLSLADVTTANVSTAKHGFTPKLPNDATKFLDGTGAWASPALALLPYVAKAVSYTLTTSDFFVRVTAGGKTMTLPTAVGVAGRRYVIDNDSTGLVYVATTSSQQIEGVLRQTLLPQSAMQVYSTGANWRIY